jgi:hypothetical protein
MAICVYKIYLLIKLMDKEIVGKLGINLPPGLVDIKNINIDNSLKPYDVRCPSPYEGKIDHKWFPGDGRYHCSFSGHDNCVECIKNDDYWSKIKELIKEKIEEKE